MDKNMVKELGSKKLVEIIIRLYENAKHNYAIYQKEKEEFENQNNNREAENTKAYAYASNYMIGEIETAVRFETAKLKRLKSVHRPVLKLLREKFGIKNKKEFLTMPRKELIHLAYECEECEVRDRFSYNNNIDLTHPGIHGYTYLNGQFELGLKELREVRRKRVPRKVSIDGNTLNKLSADALADILVDLYDNCVRIYDFHTKYKQEYFDKNSMRQYEYEMNFCYGFYNAYSTIENYCTIE